MESNKQKKKKISILILDNFKTERVHLNVESLQKQKCNYDVEIIVGDNSGNWKTNRRFDALLKYPNVRVNYHDYNMGYSKGSNFDAKDATGDYIFIVNPDINITEPDTLQKMTDYMEQNPDIAILGPKQIIDSNGEIEMTVRAFPKLRIQISRRTFLRHLPFIKEAVAFDEMRHLDYEKIQNVDWLQSSFVIIRKDFWEKVGGFCEDFFLFMADPHICFQAWSDNQRVVYNPNIRVYADGIRHGAGGIIKFCKNWILRQHLVDAIKYQIKHFMKPNPRLVYEKKHKNLKKD